MTKSKLGAESVQSNPELLEKYASFQEQEFILTQKVTGEDIVHLMATCRIALEGAAETLEECSRKSEYKTEKAQAFGAISTLHLIAKMQKQIDYVLCRTALDPKHGNEIEIK